MNKFSNNSWGKHAELSTRRRKVEGGCFFFTVNLENRRQKLLTEHVDLLRQAFAHVRKQHPFAIDAIVILPDHLHTLWTLPVGDTDYSMRWRMIKSYFSRNLPKTEHRQASRIAKNERGIWQRKYWEHAITDEEDFRHHVEYIHFNPVKHGHTGRPIDWQYSSFHKYVQRGTYPAEWCTCELVLDHDL